ncbi:MAG: glycosyltransferase family 39 protein [Chloroflexota bacterium]
MTGLIDGDTLLANSVSMRERTIPGSTRAVATEIAVFTLLLLVAIAMRGINLTGFSGDLDEGIRGIQLLLMRNGFRPFQDIYASQGPLLLDLLYPLYIAFGGSLAAVRLAVGAYSLIGIVGTYLISRSLAGPVGAAAATTLLVLSPTYLRNSRQALAENVALGPAVLAIWAALQYQRRGSSAWLLAAGVLLGVSLLIKPITIAAALPVGLCVLMRGGRPLRGLLTLGCVVAAVVLLVSLMSGLAGVFDQVVEYRLKTRDLDSWKLRENWAVIQTALGRDQLAVFGLAVLGGLALAILSPKAGIPLGVWGIATILLLLFYSPLFPKHTVVMMPPVAILAGAGLGRLWQYLHGEHRRLSIAHFGFMLPLGWYLISLPGLLGWDARYMNLLPGNELPRFAESADVVRSIVALTEPSDYVITDHPYLAFLAQRLVPPALADPSKTRLRTRELTGQEIVQAGTTYPSKIAVMWEDRFRSLPVFRGWFDETYQVVKMYVKRGDQPRYISMRRDSDFGRARSALTAGLERRSGAEFAGELRLGAFGVERSQLPPGGQAGLTLEWEAIRPLSADYHILISLNGADGSAWDSQELSIFGRGESASDWNAGRWLVQVATISVPADMAPGDYQIFVSVYDTKNRRTAPVTYRPSAVPGAQERDVPVATIEVK